MALQGTIETFSLSDVLHLLADTRKTGVLRLVGTRGSGEVYVADGQLVSIGADGLTDGATPADALFELLRFPDGSFSFDPEGRPETAGEPQDLEAVLSEAKSRLDEWQDIAAVIPSDDAWLTLATTLTGADVVVDQNRWQAIAAVGSGITVSDLGDRFDLDDMASFRLARELVELGMVYVEAAPPAPEPVDLAEPAPLDLDPPGASEPLPTEPSAAHEPLPTEPSAAHEPLTNGWESDTGLPPLEPAESSLSDFGLDDLPYDTSAQPADPLPPLFAETPAAPGFDLFAEVPPAADPAPEAAVPEAPASDGPPADMPPQRPTDGSANPDPADAAEVARQLASLSPRAARAVAAAARASTQEERDAALAEVEAEEGDSLNRGLLMKFLSSVQD